MAADDLVGDRLSEEQTALHPPEDCDESDEEEERINAIKKADKDEAFADGADDTLDDQWNSVAEPEMIDFGVWTKVSAPGVNNDQGKKADDADVEMPDYGGDDDGVEVIEDDDEEMPATGDKRKPEGLPESSTAGAAAKVATKKMPKPSEPAPRRKVQKIVRYDDT